MSRDISGNYTLPGAVNPVVAGTNITITWANSTLNDIAAALTDSLSRAGNGGMSAPLKLVAGSVAAPGISFSSESSSGWYLAGAGDVRFSLGGVQLIRLNAGVMTVTSAAATDFTATNLTVTNLTLSTPLPVVSGGTGATTDTGARAALSAAKLGANADITSMSAVTGIGNTANTHLQFSSAGRAGFNTGSFGFDGVSLPPAQNFGWAEGTDNALAVSFRQASSGAYVIGSGVKYSANAYAFASATTSSWRHSALEVGYNGLRFYAKGDSAVSVGTDVTMEEQFRVETGGVQSSRIPGSSAMYPQFMCRAWMNFDGTGTAASRASGNCTLTDNGTGDYTISFTTAMPDANFSVAGTVSQTGTDIRDIAPIAFATGSVRVRTGVSGVGYNDCQFVSVQIFR